MIPTHVGIIPDGNRRFGKKHGLSIVQAYEKGIDKLKEVCEWSKDLGIKILTVWGFSTENFQRNPVEKEAFFRLLNIKINETIRSKELNRRDIKINIIGKIERFPQYLQKSFQRLTESTKSGSLKLNIALGYGGRQEIIDAVNKIIKNKVEKVNEKVFSQFLYTSEEPDLIIRTSGEKRLSGFLPWQSVYSELVFLKPLWPEITRADFVSAIKEFSRRERRFGR